MSGGGRADPEPVELAAVLARARGFVAREGSPLSRLHLAVLLGDRPPCELADRVEARQTDSGAIAPLEGREAAGVTSTAQAFGLLDDLRLLHLPCAERASSWLATQQRPDGSFHPEGPSSQERRELFTASLAGRLARSPSVSLEVLEAAGRFVGRGFSVERVQRGGWETLASLLPFFANHPHELSDAALQWCGRELERGFRSGCFDPVETARIFTLCDARALPGARVEAGELVRAIVARQAPDGGFGALDAGVGRRVAASLDAVLGLVRLGT